MPDLAAAVTAVTDTLNAAGVSAAFDMRDLNVPGIYVTPPTVAYRFAKGDWDADWTAYAVAMSSGRTEALAELGILIDAAQEALYDVVVAATPADLDPLDGGPRLPSYRLTWTSKVEGHPHA